MFDICLCIYGSSDELIIQRFNCSSVVVNSGEVLVYEKDGVYSISRDCVSMIDLDLRGVKLELV